MAMTRHVTIGVIAAVMAGCATSAGTGTRLMTAQIVGPEAVTNVGVEPKTIDPSTGQAATVRYHLSDAASVQLDLVDEDGHVIRRVESGSQLAGSHQVVWDGCATSGAIAPRGVYRYVIIAQGPRGQAIHDPSPQTGGEELTPTEFTFDSASGTLRWVMPKAGRVRLTLGLEGFPRLRTLLDWEPLAAGEQSVVWDGADSSGLMKLKEHPNLSIKLQAFALSFNTIIVRGQPGDVPEAHAAAAYPSSVKDAGAYMHARHPRAVCHEVRARIEFPDGTPRDARDRPLLRGRVPVRVVLDEADAPHLINQRFEVALFEDTVLLFEEEEGSNPLTYLWDTTSLPSGEHLLTVNILSYDDHYGVVTLPVVIGAQG